MIENPFGLIRPWDYWIGGRETWFSQYYAKPGDYTRGEVHTDKSELNEVDPSHCPHCNSNHSMWAMQDGDDLYCWQCGWRDSLYFNKRVSGYIKRRIIAEEKAGTSVPQRLTDIDSKYGIVNPPEKHPLSEGMAESALRNKRLRTNKWRSEHKEEVREKTRQWKLANKDRVSVMNRRYRLNHPGQVAEACHNAYLKRKAEKQRQKSVAMVGLDIIQKDIL